MSNICFLIAARNGKNPQLYVAQSRAIFKIIYIVNSNVISGISVLPFLEMLFKHFSSNYGSHIAPSCFPHSELHMMHKSLHSRHRD